MGKKRVTDQLNYFPCATETDAKNRAQIHVNGAQKKILCRSETQSMYFSQPALPPPPLKAYSPREGASVHGLEGICSMCQLSGLLEPAFALCALQHIASPSVWGRKSNKGTS